MSVDIPDGVDAGLEELPTPSYEQRRAVQPAAHGSSVQNVFADLDPSGEEPTCYDRALAYWREHVGSRNDEPHVVAELDHTEYDWLVEPRGNTEFVLALTSSKWKVGSGTGDDYRPYYQYHLKLRERDLETGELSKGPLALHVELMPQYRDLNYKDGNALECPYGEGTRVVCWTTWAESPTEVETRAYDAIAAWFGDDVLALADRVEESRRIAKAEAHVRFHIDRKNAVVETVEQSKQLLAFGGRPEIDAHQARQREGWLEAGFSADRWPLLGFAEQQFEIGLKVYQAGNWHEQPETSPYHHPKLEAYFAGADGQLPHVDDWDEALQTLRAVVSTHLEWAGVETTDLIADDFFDGASADRYEYTKPTGRRDQLRSRYESVATEVYREALKPNTVAVYDILRVMAIESGATYDVLEERTGLARSTIRHHVRRLDQCGIVERIGNPRLVVFPSLAALDRAEEILREVYPDDTVDDMAERAEEREERREERADADSAAESDGDDAADGSTWAYFDDLALDPDELANALAREYVERDHVRVRTDPYPFITRE